MNGFQLNVLLAIVWALFSGNVNLRELIIGFLIGFALLSLFPDALGTRQYQRTSFALLRFLGMFLKELTVANVQVALMALTPRPNLNPMIFKVPLQRHSEMSLPILGAVVTLMPGSVILGFSADQRELYVHAIGLPSTQAARESILRVERALLAFMAPPQQTKEVNA